jgi:hypothetical protein
MEGVEGPAEVTPLLENCWLIEELLVKNIVAPHINRHSRINSRRAVQLAERTHGGLCSSAAVTRYLHCL